MAKLGFVGLGVMGSRVVKRLLAAGHPVTGYNRTRAKAEWLVQAGMQWGESPRSVAESSDIVFSMVTNTEALRAIAHGDDGILAGLSAGKVYIDMSTVSPAASRGIAAQVAELGAQMLDAPVSGSVITLEEGKLSIMVAGQEAAYAIVLPGFDELVHQGRCRCESYPSPLPAGRNTQCRCQMGLARAKTARDDGRTAFRHEHRPELTEVAFAEGMIDQHPRLGLAVRRDVVGDEPRVDGRQLGRDVVIDLAGQPGAVLAHPALLIHPHPDFTSRPLPRVRDVRQVTHLRHQFEPREDQERVGPSRRAVAARLVGVLGRRRADDAVFVKHGETGRPVVVVHGPDEDGRGAVHDG